MIKKSLDLQENNHDYQNTKKRKKKSIIYFIKYLFYTHISFSIVI